MAGVFVGQVIRSHPEYLNRYLQNYASLSMCQKAVLLRGIRVAGRDHEVLKTIEDPKLRKLVFVGDVTSFEGLQNFHIKQPEDLDLLWVSFFATGERTYLRQIIKFLDLDDEVLFFGYELINRREVAKRVSQLTGKHVPPNTKDLYQHFEKRDRESPGFKNRAFTVSAALWSLESNAKQDQVVRKIAGEITTGEPRLDYWKRINRMLGH